MRAIILAGGEGLRLRPLTNDLPKVLLPLNNRPICLYQIDWLRKYEIKEITFAIGYLGDKIQEELGDGSKFGVNISYAMEDSPLDTAGAIRNAFDSLNVDERKSSARGGFLPVRQADALGENADLRRFKDQPFLVLNGDTLTNIDLSKLLDFHFKKEVLITICLVESFESSSYGVVSFDPEGRIKGFDEKPNLKAKSYINAGIYVMQSEVIEYIPRRKRYSFEREFIPDLIKRDLRLYGYKTEGYWIDIGIPERYKRVQEDILKIKI